MRKFNWFIPLHAGITAGIVNTAIAAEPSPGVDPEDTILLDTYIVSALKKDTDIQKTPLSITALQDDFLQDANVINTLEATYYAPSVYLKKSTSENVISIRGITAFDTSVYSPTAMYVDDVMIPLHYAHNIDLMDIERIEILRGPQGSLYGGNSLAGVINVITRYPDEHQRMEVTGSVSSYPGIDGDPMAYEVGGILSGPVTADTLYAGLAFKWRKDDGFTNNLWNDDDSAASLDHQSLRGTLRWTPDEDFDIRFTADFMENDDRIGVYRFETGPYVTEKYHINQNADQFQKEKSDGQTLRIDHAGDKVNLLSVTGRRDYSNENLQDYDATADPMNDWGSFLSNYDDRFLSQEFRLTPANRDGRLDWLLGLYGFREDTDIRQVNALFGQETETNIETTGYALFGELSYRPIDRLELTGGLRYDIQDLRGKRTDGSTQLSKDLEFDELLPKVSVGYDFRDNIYGYATVSTGYLVGGYNYSLANDQDSFVYDPEYARNHEIGIKTTWLDRRLTANLTAYYIEMKDKQVYELAGGSSPTTRVDNAAEAHSKGLELEVLAQLDSGLDLIAGLGYTSAEYDDWVATEWNSTYTGQVRNDYGGKHLTNVPEYTANLGLQYRRGNGFFSRLDLILVGAMYADHANNFKEDAYSLVNVHIGYETDDFDIILWGKNIFDTEYNAIAYDWDGAKLVQDGTPAQFGIRANLRF